jgi:hypothetical protein
MSTFSISFKDAAELIQFATKFIVDDRLNSLENDVYRCVPKVIDKQEETCNAPFPALLYCFSIIDLLGALYAGHAKSGQTTSNSGRYMKDFLSYTQDKLFLLQKIYRHTTVHLSQPKPAMLYNSQTIAWKHDENDPSKHLSIDPTPGTADIYGKGKIQCDGQYIVSIWQLKDDIKKSVTGLPDGYIEKLKKDANLQKKFVTAVNQFFDPAIAV